MRLIKEGKIFLILVFAFILTSLISRTIFLSGTPKLNQFFFAQLSKMFNPVKAPAQLSQSKINEALEKAVYHSMTKGVYAGEYQEIQVYKVVNDEVDWITYTFNLNNGKTITLQVPQGSSPPTQQYAESLATK